MALSDSISVMIKLSYIQSEEEKGQRHAIICPFFQNWAQVFKASLT